MLNVIAPSSGPVLPVTLYSVTVGITPNRYPLQCLLAIAATGKSTNLEKPGVIMTAPTDFPGQNNTQHIALDGQVSSTTPWKNAQMYRRDPSQTTYLVEQPNGSFQYTHVVVPGVDLNFYHSAPDTAPNIVTSADVTCRWDGNLLKCAVSFIYSGPGSGGNPNFQDIYYGIAKVDATGKMGWKSGRYRIGPSGSTRLTASQAYDYVVVHGGFSTPSVRVCTSYLADPQFETCLSQTRYLVKSLKNNPIWDFRYQPPNTWGELAYQAYSKVQLFSGNGIAYLKDMKEIRKTVDGLGEILKLLGPEGRTTKAIVNAYLLWHYGASLTISDTKSLINAMKKFSFTHNPSFRHYGSAYSHFSDDAEITFRYEAFIPPLDESIRELGDLLYDFDLLPNSGNLWDLIPYSFVIDWFVSVGDCLDRIDMTKEISRLRISYVCYSEKAIGPFELPIGLEGNVSYKTYRRWFRKDPEMPTPVLEPTPNPIKHMLDGSVLVLQKIL